ncbi:MAG: S8 family peptidase, partial [Bacteroidia bacterium]|nr:S8 family peptidase [Bacteroidia bacterium]
LTSALADRQQVIDQIRNDALFEFEFPVITKEPQLNRTFNRWIRTDNDILVTFRNPYITPAAVQYFTQKYDLILTHQPSPQLPVGNHTYFFRLATGRCINNTSISVASSIWEQDSAMVLISEPDIYYPAYQFTNDPYFGAQWHLKNTGQCLGFYPSGNALSSANCRIEDAWDLGYTGSGVKVAVIDNTGFKLDHPDLENQFTDGWNCVDNVAYITHTGSGHGQACAGLIAAKADNSEGTVGVAYNAKIVPYVVGGYYSTYTLAFQKALEQNVDVISCSWGWNDWYISSCNPAIQNCKILGRGGKGCIIVAACGNFPHGGNIPNQSDGVWPANLPDVIGVIASNPSDKLKSTTSYNTLNQPPPPNNTNPDDGWGASNTPDNNWGSNYGQYYDIAAPGTHVITTDYPWGSYNTGTSLSYNYFHNYCDATGNSDLALGYTYFNGTSAAAPIVAGVAALILSKNPTLTSNQVQEIIQQGADKVGGYNYNAVSPGKSLEFGYGRINAFNSINLTNGINDIKKEVGIISVVNPVRQQLEIVYKLNDSAPKIHFHLYDLLGRTSCSGALNPQATYFSTDISKLPAGLYVITFTDEKGIVLQSDKLIKVE